MLLVVVQWCLYKPSGISDILGTNQQDPARSRFNCYVCNRIAILELTHDEAKTRRHIRVQSNSTRPAAAYSISGYRL